MSTTLLHPLLFAKFFFLCAVVFSSHLRFWLRLRLLIAVTAALDALTQCDTHPLAVM